MEQNEPFVQWKHIDGPTLRKSDGTYRLLTAGEIRGIDAGDTTVHELDDTYNATESNADDN